MTEEIIFEWADRMSEPIYVGEIPIPYVLVIVLMLTSICIGIYVIYLIVTMLIHTFYERKVRNHSVYYRQLIELNSISCFDETLEYEYIMHERLDTKTKYNRYDFGNAFEFMIEQEQLYYETLIKKFEENRKLYDQYILKYQEIISSAENENTSSKKLFFNIYKKTEKTLLLVEKLCVPYSPNFILNAYYTSPQGRNHYHSQHMFYYDELKEHYDNVLRKKKNRQSRYYERKRMTPSLRYEILQRDRFRCVLCGCSAKDGVTLHVDHIQPVSKGGKTTRANLRTLCESCNLGKHDKYVFNGLN